MGGRVKVDTAEHNTLANPAVASMARAMRMMSLTGLTVPRALDT